jgi:hypothetical protein
VIEQIPGEQRFVAAYYSQGIKIVDYFVDADGHLQFREASSFTLRNANTWAAEQFKIENNADDTRTYSIAADDIHRGIDVVRWNGRPNPIGAPAPAAASTGGSTNLSLLAAAAGPPARAAPWPRPRARSRRARAAETKGSRQRRAHARVAGSGRVARSCRRGDRDSEDVLYQGRAPARCAPAAARSAYSAAGSGCGRWLARSGRRPAVRPQAESRGT